MDINKIYQFNAFETEFKKIDEKNLLLLEHFVDFRSHNGTLRLQNLIKNFLKENSFAEFIKKIELSLKGKVTYRNIGEAAINELEQLYDDLIKLHQCVKTETKTDEEHFEKLRIILSLYFNIDPKFINNYKNDFLNHKFPIFTFVEEILKNFILVSRETHILTYNLEYYKNIKQKTMVHLAKELHCTHELVRLIKMAIINKIRLFLSTFGYQLDFTWNYIELPFSKDADYIFIDENVVNKLNIQENSNFTGNYIIFVLSVLFNKTHRRLLDNEKKNKQYFLIKNNLYNNFNFDEFFNDMNDRSSVIKTEYDLNLNDYLLSFTKNDFKKGYFKIKECCQKIIANVCKLEVNDKTIFFRRRVRKICDIAKDILELHNKPMHVTELYEEFNRLYPGRIKTIDSIRNIPCRDSELTYIGRSSTYALKRWEIEHENFKGGTIRDLAEEFLATFDEPKHISEIFNYVKKYRQTTASNILTSIKVDTNNRFVVYQSSFVGLANKKYHIKFKEIKKIPSGLRGVIVKFLKANDNKYDFKELLIMFSKKYHLDKVQVESIIMKNIDAGVFIMKENGVLALNK